MKDLIGTYSIQEIVSFLVIFALAIKGFVSFWDWTYARLKAVFRKETDQEQEKTNIQNQVHKNKESLIEYPVLIM